jgi:hypothetical protein
MSLSCDPSFVSWQDIFGWRNQRNRGVHAPRIITDTLLKNQWRLPSLVFTSKTTTSTKKSRLKGWAEERFMSFLFSSLRCSVWKRQRSDNKLCPRRLQKKLRRKTQLSSSSRSKELLQNNQEVKSVYVIFLSVSFMTCSALHFRINIKTLRNLHFLMSRDKRIKRKEGASKTDPNRFSCRNLLSHVMCFHFLFALKKKEVRVGITHDFIRKKNSEWKSPENEEDLRMTAFQFPRD